jgi:glucose/arabinose dehydrogenase
VIFRQQPAMSGGHHFGSRLVFGRDGNLFVTLGDRNKGRASVQLLDNHIENETHNNIHIITDYFCLLWNNNQSDKGY